MKAKITKTLLSDIVPKDKSFEICDSELSGFLIRILPSGTITFMVSYRFLGKKNRITIGRHPVLNVIQAREEAKRILAGLALGEDPGVRKQLKKAPPAQLTLKKFIEDDYKADRVAINRKNGTETINRLKSAFKDLLDVPLNDIDAKKISDWRTSRLNTGKAKSTINRDLNAIKSMFSQAAAWKTIPANPLSGYKLLEIDSVPLTRYLNAEEEKRLLKALDDTEQEIAAARERGNVWRKQRGYPILSEISDPLKAMVIVALNTGIRWGSLVGLRWSDIDFDKAILTVRSTIEKSSKNIHIPLNGKVMDEIKRWKKATGCENLMQLIFPGRAENQIKDNVNKAWAGVKNKAEIVNFRWHDLRHTFASKLVMRGVDLNTVRELMGHSDIKMTLKYAHLAPEHKAAAVAVL